MTTPGEESYVYVCARPRQSENEVLEKVKLHGIDILKDFREGEV